MHKNVLPNNRSHKHTTDGLNTRQQTKWMWKLLHVPFKIGKEFTCPLIWSNLVRNVPWKKNPVRKEVVCRCSMFRQTLIIGERQWICDRVCKTIFWSGPSSRMPPPRLMKCHYEVLEAPRYVSHNQQIDFYCPFALSVFFPIRNRKLDDTNDHKPGILMPISSRSSTGKWP